MKAIFRWIFKFLKYCFISLFTLLVIWFALAMNHRINVFRVCAELPNGLRIGYAALFDPQDFVWHPDVVLKLPDGRSLLSDHIEDFYFTKTTVYGHAGPSYDQSIDYAFLYRPDIGLVLEIDEPKKYEKLKKEAGPIIWLRGDLVHINLLGTYYKAIEKPAYLRSKCKLNFFPDRQKFNFNKVWYPFKKYTGSRIFR